MFVSPFVKWDDNIYNVNTMFDFMTKWDKSYKSSYKLSGTCSMNDKIWKMLRDRWNWNILRNRWIEGYSTLLFEHHFSF